MSPIDDELRAALHGRASSLAPSSDPLAGIERRAERLRRNRIGAAVAGSALAVAAVAAVVPAVQSATSSPDPRPPVMASAEPTPSPQPTAYALDPEDPWTFRGTPVDEGTRATIQGEYATRTGGSEILVTPLFAQVYEPSAQLEVVFLAEVDGAYRWGVAQSSESGPEFLWDEPLPDPARALVAALPGDEVAARLLVVAAPEVDEVSYLPDASDGMTMAPLADGVGTIGVESNPPNDRFLLLVEGEEVFRAPAPDLAVMVTLPGYDGDGEGPGTDQAPEIDTSGYALDPADPWEFRGDAAVRDVLAPQDGALLGQWPGRMSDAYDTHALYAGRSDAGTSYLVQLHDAMDGEQVVVTTTTRRGDRAPEQSVQPVEAGMLLVQLLVPTDLDDGSVLLVAVASPDASELVLQQDSARPDDGGGPGVGLWLLESGQRSGEILLYRSGDGLLYHVEQVRLD